MHTSARLFVSEHESKKGKTVNFDVCKNPSKLIGYQLKVKSYSIIPSANNIIPMARVMGHGLW